jgi:hypothetical protein
MKKRARRRGQSAGPRQCPLTGTTLRTGTARLQRGMVDER